MFKPGEVILVICVFSFVVCCFSIPIIIYATSSDVTPSQDIGIEIDVDNCPQQVIKAYVYYGAKYCDYYIHRRVQQCYSQNITYS